LEEVSFTAYYPASPTTKKEQSRWLNWLPRYVLHYFFEAQTKSLPLADLWQRPSEVIHVSQVSHGTFIMSKAPSETWNHLAGISAFILWPVFLMVRAYG